MTYGRDLHCTTRLLPSMPEVTGARLMAQICCRRCYTPPGGLLSDRFAVTVDLRSYLSSDISPDRRELAVIKSAALAAIQDDPRVLYVTIDPSYDSTSRMVRLAIKGQGSEGPFALVLGITSLTVDILEGRTP